MSVIKEMETAGDKSKYDDNAKILLSNKAVLARILKLAVPEYKDEPLDAIESYIHDGVQVGVAAVDANTKDLEGHHVGHRILPLSGESNDIKNGRVTYDVFLAVDLPKKFASKTQLYIFVNIEQQLDFNPNYPIASRSVYYLSRQISSLKNTVFQGEDYGKIKKCYSIWLCPDTKRERKSYVSILEFKVNDLFNHCNFNHSSYEKMAAIFCSFQPGEEGNELCKFLDTLFSAEKSLEERKRILEVEYGIKDDEVEGIIRKMCNLSEGIYSSGYGSGVADGTDIGEDRLAEYIAKLMKEGNLEEIGKVSSDKEYRKMALARFEKEKEEAEKRKKEAVTA